MNNDLVKALFASPSISVAACDGKGRIQQSNRAFQTFLGYTESELTDRCLSEFHFAPEGSSEDVPDQEWLIKNKGQITTNVCYRTKTGKTLTGQTEVHSLHDEDGKCSSVVVLITDVTHQQRNEHLMAGQAAVLSHLYQNDSLEDICTTIVNTIENLEVGLICSILKLNESTHTLHKLAAPNLPDFYNDAIEGMQIGPTVGSCGSSAFLKRRVIVEDILEHPNWKRARRLVKKTKLRACWSEPIFANDGSVLGTFAMYYEQPRKPTPKELELIKTAADLTAVAINHKQALVALQKSNALKNELISTAAHELRTPLGTIMGYAELLSLSKKADGLTKEDHQFLELIIQKAEMLSRIVGDLFDISKLENGYRLELKKKKISIIRTVTNVVDYYKRVSPNHTFCLETINDLPERIEVDEEKIIQVLDNLISNAVKYSPDGGLIKIVASAKHNQLQLSITDRGIGMNGEQLERIFEKFYRANDEATTAKGLGLGMSIVKEIIEAHGGEIKVNSQKGVGTRVQFTIPGN